jgi:3-mercaptopyruvate sulfurtransferase SseA
MPGSLSVPFQKVIDPETGELLDSKLLQKFFKEELGRFKNVVASCGTGIYCVWE